MTGLFSASKDNIQHIRMYLQALLPILFVASVAMMSTMSTTFKDLTTDFPALTTTDFPALTTTNFPALTTTMSTEPNLCNTDLTFVCETPDEMTLSVLYAGLFTPASQETTFRKRRQSLGSCPNPNGSYAILQLGNDKDMCCIKHRQLKALCVIKDVFGVTYEVVHLLGFGLYQFLPYTSCGKNTCSGQCLQQFTPTSVLVWNSSQGFPWVKFTTVSLPTHCSCLNVGG